MAAQTAEGFERVRHAAVGELKAVVASANAGGLLGGQAREGPAVAESRWVARAYAAAAPWPVFAV